MDVPGTEVSIGTYEAFVERHAARLHAALVARYPHRRDAPTD
jgi:hypothetical protein